MSLYSIARVPNPNYIEPKELKSRFAVLMAAKVMHKNLGLKNEYQERNAQMVKTIRKELKASGIQTIFKRKFFKTEVVACKSLGYKGVQQHIRDCYRDMRAENRRVRIQMHHERTRASIPHIMFKSFGADKPARIYTEEGSFLKMYKARIIDKVFKDKKPMSASNHVGVEIEFFTSDEYGNDDIAEKFAEVGLNDNVTLKSDGSIDASRDCTGHEIAIIASEDKIADVVTKVCDVLNTFGAEVNSSCGLHVHIDARGRDPYNTYKRLVMAQKWLFKLVPGSRRDNRYARVVPAKVNNLEAITDRYFAVNSQAYKKYKTIEVRLHSGTVDAKKINHWIELLLAIVAKPIARSRSSSLSAWLKSLFVSADTMAYYIERAKKFEGASTVDPEHAELPEPQEDEYDHDSDEHEHCERCGDCVHDGLLDDNLCEPCTDIVVENQTAARG